MIGRIKFWNSERQFGFLVTEDGREFYVGSGNFTRLFSEGARVQFEPRANDEDVWVKALNNGELRDKGLKNPRNPRPPRRFQAAKPAAVNVVLIGEKS